MNQGTTKLRRILSRGLFPIALLSLVSCSNTPSPELSVTSVSIYAEPDANDNSAIAVDLVFVYDFDLLRTISQMSAAKYFAASDQLLLDNPTLLDVWHWELVPGQLVQDFKPPQNKGDMYGAYVFANYLTPGDHRVRVAPHGVVRILLLQKDLRNLAMLDIPDWKKGSTFPNANANSNTPCEDLCQAAAREGEICKKRGTTSAENSSIKSCPKLGPTKSPRNLCKKCAPQVTQGPMCKKTTYSHKCSPFGKPIPIVARPLSSSVTSSTSKKYVR